MKKKNLSVNKMLRMMKKKIMMTNKMKKKKNLIEEKKEKLREMDIKKDLEKKEA